MRTLVVFVLFVFLIALSAVFSAASAQSPEGGVIYTMSHAVVGGGGGKSGADSTMSVEGTFGQAIAGTTSSGGQYSLHGGFWFGDALQPTAAPASISGRVNGLAAFGTAVRRVRVVLTDLATNEVRVARVNIAGYYQFDELEVEHLYLLRAEGPSITFAPDSVTISLLDNVTGVDFSATAAH